MKGKMMQITLYRKGLIVSMCLLLLLLGITFYAWNSPQGIFAMFLMIIPGQAGVYFSTKIQNSRIKWLLITINYFLSTILTWTQVLDFYLSYLR
jgi:hypothetical protein